MRVSNVPTHIKYARPNASCRQIIFNFGQSLIDCVVRRLTDEGATIELQSALGVPEHFQLSLVSEGALLPCQRVWQSEKQIGITFTARAVEGGERQRKQESERGSERGLRSQMLALHAALDQMPLGIVLLDSQLNARFINKSFRRMWALPDQVADHHPSFAALMFHGRDTGAYEVPVEQLDAYIAGRIERVTKNESFQIDLRLTNDGVLRMQCTPLPDGGRMLSYMEVTDIIRQSDELKVLRDALDNLQDGVLLLDADLRATFVNRKVRQFWELTEEEAAAKPLYTELITRARRAIGPNLPNKSLSSFAVARAAEVKAGGHTRELQTPDNRRLRAHCTNLGSGGRMITYYDVTDLFRSAEKLEVLATTDSLTGLYNRRHFLEVLEGEWSRFQRYYRSLSVLMIDIDHFKSVNDQHGHAVGDDAIRSMADACLQGKRKSDIVGRIGGEEFAILLPETTLSQAKAVAERIRKRVASQVLKAGEATFHITASIGISEAYPFMSSADSLIGAADQALYQAKAQGRNRCVSFVPTENGQATEPPRVEGNLPLTARKVRRVY